MGLFENLGKKVERFKQQAESAASEEASHVCGDCGEALYTDQDQCPHCGSENVVEREAESDTTEA